MAVFFPITIHFLILQLSWLTLFPIFYFLKGHIFPWDLIEALQAREAADNWRDATQGESGLNLCKALKGCFVSMMLWAKRSYQKLSQTNTISPIICCPLDCSGMYRICCVFSSHADAQICYLGKTSRNKAEWLNGANGITAEDWGRKRRQPSIYDHNWAQNYSYKSCWSLSESPHDWAQFYDLFWLSNPIACNGFCFLFLLENGSQYWSLAKTCDSGMA